MSQTTTDSVLRLITAGSVDDGKSTLIGRILYDSHALLADQLAQISNTNQASTIDNEPNFALLTDGLTAEREQGITIDVAYRYFSTNDRKFILADTPGHEQYTRNMVTGASTADAAIILIDATRLDFSQEPLELLLQTKRHSALLQLLGCPHLIIAVNKLDLIDYSQEKFNQIVEAYKKIMQTLGIEQVYFVPISALKGDNIISSSENTPWYTGPSLLQILTSLDSTATLSDYDNLPLHLPVQKVIRQDGSTAEDFRGYQGRVEQGTISTNQEVRILPNEQKTSIKEIYGVNGLIDSASTGNNVTVVLNDDIDVSRGDAILSLDNPNTETKKIKATICWLDTQALNPARKYWLKQTTTTVPVKIKNINSILDINTLTSHTQHDKINMNDIAEVDILLQQPIVANHYSQNRATGSFILIDETSNQTVAAGMINALDF
ncbi:sulfate adenylyltransferase [Neisseriaceae bacterium PsAf]|nr:sulfate adenylyltransferase [Neisseriaceae bacterium PsAf]